MIDSTRYIKSRTFVVLLEVGPSLLLAHSLVRMRRLEGSEDSKLNHQQMDLKLDNFYSFGQMQYNSGDLSLFKSQIISLLKMSGVTARFYDPNERKWMDDSTQFGLVSVRGSRDGQWGVPDLEEFEEDYIEAV